MNRGARTGCQCRQIVTTEQISPEFLFADIDVTPGKRVRLSLGKSGRGTPVASASCWVAVSRRWVLLLGAAAFCGASHRRLTPCRCRASPTCGTGSAVYGALIAISAGDGGCRAAEVARRQRPARQWLLGMGWSFSGLPSIARCPCTMAQDGLTGGVNFASNDRFCFGSQSGVVIVGRTARMSASIEAGDLGQTPSSCGADPHFCNR
jgi:hypothetical protein